MNGADNGSPPALNSGDWETIYNVAADGNVGGGEYVATTEAAILIQVAYIHNEDLHYN